MTTTNGKIYLGDKLVAGGDGNASELLEPTTYISSPLSSYAAPTIGQAALSFSRNFEASQQTSTEGIWTEAAHNTAAYTYDFVLGRTRYKSTRERISAITFGNARNLTTASWVKTNATAALNQTGITNVANSASLLTATADNATAILDCGTIAAATRNFSVFLRRVAGSGRIWITRNGGTNWQDVTSLVNSGAWTRVSLTTGVADPDVGIRLEASGDSVGVDAAADVPGAAPFDPFISRSDQRGSTLTLSALKPELPTGRRYNLRVRVRPRGASAELALALDNGVDITQEGISWSRGGNGTSNIASWSGGTLRFNAGGLGSPILSGQDYIIDLLWGGRRIDLIQNGVLSSSLDNGANPDPNTLSRLFITGDAEFADLEIRELRSHNVVLVGDSITAAPAYPAIFRRRLDPYAYTIAARGVGGDRIADVTARVASGITTAHIQRASSNVVVLWIGTNTLAENVSAATALSQLTTLISTIKTGAAWTQVICVTTLKRGGGFSGGATAASFETNRVAYNAGLTTAGADAVIDLDGVAEASDPSWFDLIQIHPNPALYEVFWPLIRAALP
jgi:hypothetical protein